MALAGLATTPARAVELLEIDTQAFVQDNGAMDVIYGLTFRDDEPRSGIRRIGQFYQPVSFTRGSLRSATISAKVAMQPLGNGYFRAEYDRTVAAGTHVLELRFRSDKRFAEPTTADGRELVAVWFNPIRWTMPVQRSVIKLVLPLPIETRVKRPEDITPTIVEKLGLVTDPLSVGEQDHWALVFADYRGERRLAAYAERRPLPAEATHQVRVFIPRSAMPALSDAPSAQTRSSSGSPAGPPGEPITSSEPLPAQGSNALSPSANTPTRGEEVSRSTPPAREEGGNFMLWLAALAILAGAWATLRQHPHFALRWWRRRRPVEYVSPEITATTSRKPGHVPELRPEEAALALERPIKTINLIVLELQQKGALRIVKRNPLQVLVIDAARATTNPEQAFIGSLSPQGTLPGLGVQKALAAVTAELRPKVWRADLDATAAALRGQAEDAWQNLRRAPADQRATLFDTLYPQLYLHDRFFSNLGEAVGTVPSANAPDTPLAVLAATREEPSFLGGVREVEAMAQSRVEAIESNARATIDRLESLFNIDGGLQAGADVNPLQVASAAGYDACHSACHSACRDACVSSCAGDF